MSIVIADIKFYTVMEVSKLLNISTPTVRNYIKQGRLKGQRVGRPILISEQSLREFLTMKEDTEAKK
jgi:excisionase family DNA binding protein